MDSGPGKQDNRDNHLSVCRITILTRQVNRPETCSKLASSFEIYFAFFIDISTPNC